MQQGNYRFLNSTVSPAIKVVSCFIVVTMITHRVEKVLLL